MGGDRVQVHLERPNEAHRSSTGTNDVQLEDVEFRVITRKRFVESKTDLLVVDVLNADAAIANALRRIMIAEVETLAVQVVGFSANTSIIPDEVLAHRVGLVPFDIDPKTFPRDSVNFDLYYECEAGDDGLVKSGHFEIGAEDKEILSELLSPEELAKILPLHKDIVLAKLIPGQKVWLRAKLCRGQGQEHAKFSPVATASYRLMPHVVVRTEDDDGNVNQKTIKEAQAIKKSCPKDVFDIEDSGMLVAKYPRNCTMCRECIRQPGWNEIISLERDVNHYIMSIESVGMIPADEIFRRACTKLKEKAEALKADLDLLE